MARKKRSRPIDIEIDKLTNSIEVATTGDQIRTNVMIVAKSEKRLIRKKDWVFNWHAELGNAQREVYRVSIEDNPHIIQGLISIGDMGDHIRMHLIESASHNRGRGKLFVGVPGNLVAKACQISFDKGYEGYVNFIAKTVLIEHYKVMLGAHVWAGNTMYLDTSASRNLVDRYMKT
ncbi:MAG TPA: hypothetical protein PKE53_05495 [Flavobacteriales bacterium]|jgi:hypothetical protein|nr:hypothetical protein [Flavobacteriales bacterium]